MFRENKPISQLPPTFLSASGSAERNGNHALLDPAVLVRILSGFFYLTIALSCCIRAYFARIEVRKFTFNTLKYSD